MRALTIGGLCLGVAGLVPVLAIGILNPLPPGYWQAWDEVQVAQKALDAGNYREAITHFRAAKREVDPGLYEEANKGLGKASRYLAEECLDAAKQFAKRGDYALAIAKAKEALKVYPCTCR